MRWMLVLACLVGCGGNQPRAQTPDDDEMVDDAPAEPAAVAPAAPRYPTNAALLALDIPDPPRLPDVPPGDEDPYAGKPAVQDEPAAPAAPAAPTRVTIVQITPAGTATEIAVSGARLAVGMKGSLQSAAGKRIAFTISKVSGGTGYATVAVPIADLRGVKSAQVQRGH